MNFYSPPSHDRIFAIYSPVGLAIQKQDKDLLWFWKNQQWNTKGGANDFPGLSFGRINDETRSVTMNTSPSLASIVNNVPSEIKNNLNMANA